MAVGPLVRGFAWLEAGHGLDDRSRAVCRQRQRRAPARRKQEQVSDVDMLIRDLFGAEDR